jgi:hypothetical protein
MRLRKSEATHLLPLHAFMARTGTFLPVSSISGGGISILFHNHFQ